MSTETKAKETGRIYLATDGVGEIIGFMSDCVAREHIAEFLHDAVSSGHRIRVVTSVESKRMGLHLGMKYPVNENRIASAAPDADRILRKLLVWINDGQSAISFASLMPPDGDPDGQTLADAVKGYFEKVDK